MPSGFLKREKEELDGYESEETREGDIGEEIIIRKKLYEKIFSIKLSFKQLC